MNENEKFELQDRIQQLEKENQELKAENEHLKNELAKKKSKSTEHPPLKIYQR